MEGFIFVMDKSTCDMYTSVKIEFLEKSHLSSEKLHQSVYYAHINIFHDCQNWYVRNYKKLNYETAIYSNKTNQISLKTVNMYNNFQLGQL